MQIQNLANPNIHLRRHDFPVLRSLQSRAHNGHAGLVPLVQIPVPQTRFRFFDQEPGRVVLLVDLETGVAHAGVTSGTVDALLVTAAVFDGALVDVRALQSGAAHELELHAGPVDVVVDAEPDVPGFNGDREVHDGQDWGGNLEAYALGAVGLGVVLEGVGQVVGVVDVDPPGEGHVAVFALHALDPEPGDHGRGFHVDHDPVRTGFHVVAAPTVSAAQADTL